jgi:hypothetical protein
LDLRIGISTSTPALNGDSKNLSRAISTIRLVVVLASVVLISGIGVYYFTANRLYDSYPYASSSRLYGSVLPFLSNATYLGPMDKSRMLVIEFFPLANAPTSFVANLTNWEKSEGLFSPVTECPVSEGFTNANGTTSMWTSTGSCSSSSLQIHTTIGQIENAMNVQLNLYKYEGQLFYANPTDPYLPTDICQYLVDIEGLDNFTSNITFA